MSAALIGTRFPAFRLPSVTLGAWPTPVRELAPGLWLKDEAASSTVYGGNKVRKLEWLLADAQRNSATALLTVGAHGSNHVLAVAKHGASLGMATHAVVFPQPGSAHVRENRAAMDVHCASVTEASAAWTAPAAIAWTWARLSRASRPYFIGPGGSGAIGTVGWVGGGLEIAEQTGHLELDEVVVAAGSAGTTAGLLAGLRAGGSRARVVAVRCVEPIALWEGRVLQIARSTLAMMRRCGADVPEIELDGLVMVDDGFQSYGAIDPDADAIIAEAAKLGVYVEPTYTVRSFRRALQDSRNGHRVLWVDTVAAHRR